MPFSKAERAAKKAETALLKVEQYHWGACSFERGVQEVGKGRHKMRGVVAIRMFNSVVTPIILISLLSVAVLISKKLEKGDNIRQDNIRQGDGSRKSEAEGTRR